MPTTWVSSFFQLDGPTQIEEKPLEWRFTHFRKLMDAGLPLVVWMDPVYEPLAQSYGVMDASNVSLHWLRLKDTETYKSAEGLSLTLPTKVHPLKDTRDYLICTHAKTELIARSIALNPFTTSHWGWLDFSLAYIFAHPTESLARLRTLSTVPLPIPLLKIPGGQESRPFQSDAWHMRFCGGFVLGDGVSISKFCKADQSLYKEHLRSGLLTWEVNGWNELERRGKLEGSWYRGFCNDSILP